MNPKEVFISHSSIDKEFVALLIELLDDHSIDHWCSYEGLIGAQQWHDEIGVALQRCDWFIVLLSPNSVESMWVKRELLYALQDNQFENKIIPVLIEPCEYKKLSWTLPILQIVDFVDSFETGCHQLLRVWGLSR